MAVSPLDANNAGIWFLRVDVDQVRGPISLRTLREWAEAGSLKADELISRDGQSWIRAADLPELGMEWVADLGAGQQCGPFNILATEHLANQGIIKSDSVLRRLTSAQERLASVPRREGQVLQLPQKPSPAGTPLQSPPPRIVELQAELRELQAELAQLREQNQSGTAGDHRALTATPAISTRERVDLLTARVQHTAALLHRMIASAGPPQAASVIARPPLTRPGRATVSPRRAAGNATIRTRPPIPILYLAEDEESMPSAAVHTEVVRELARVRHFRVQTMRWHLINSSLVVGTGTTVAAVGVFFDAQHAVNPVTWTGLVLATLGGLHFLITTMIWIARKLFATGAVNVHSQVQTNQEQGALRGVLSISIFWFNRHIRGRQ